MVAVTVTKSVEKSINQMMKKRFSLKQPENAEEN